MEGPDEHRGPSQTTPPPSPRRGRRPKTAVAAENLVGAGQVALLQAHLDRYRNAYTHPNRKLHYDDVVVGMLYGFYNPLARSTRAIELLSQLRPAAAPAI